MNSWRTSRNNQLIESRCDGLTKAWLLVNAGVLLLLWGVSWLFWGIYSYIDPPAEYSPSNMMLPANLFGQSGILFGLLLLIYGARSTKLPSGIASLPAIKTEPEIKDIRKRGRKMAVVGALFELWGVLFLVLAIYNLVFLRGTPDANNNVTEQLLCFLPGLVFGVPLLSLGSRMLIFGEEQ